MKDIDPITAVHVVLDYVSETEDRFIRVYNKDAEPMVDRWIYSFAHQTDQEIANKYSHLNCGGLHVCDVIVPAGVRIKGWAAPNSDRAYIYEIESVPGIVFINDRELPAPDVQRHVTNGLRAMLNYTTNQDGGFVRLYDKKMFQMEGPWVFNPAHVKGRSPEQMQEYFDLPFLPTFICDVMIASGTKVAAYASPRSEKPNVYRVESGMTFLNERLLQLK